VPADFAASRLSTHNSRSAQASGSKKAKIAPMIFTQYTGSEGPLRRRGSPRNPSARPVACRSPPRGAREIRLRWTEAEDFPADGHRSMTHRNGTKAPAAPWGWLALALVCSCTRPDPQLPRRPERPRTGPNPTDLRDRAEALFGPAPGRTAFDRFLRREGRLTRSQRVGLRVFIARCASCHLGPQLAGARATAGRLDGDGKPVQVPSLRDLSRTGPYLADASAETLEQVVRQTGEDHRESGTWDPKDVSAVVSFLKSLREKPSDSTDETPAR
jgi:mono/diheme cytochrome c family protein